MSYLLDSHVLLWWLGDSPKIGPTLRARLADPKTRVLVSAASVWEIALGKLRIPEAVPDLLQEEGFEELSITARHAQAAADLPPLHRDPFDRMLVAQAGLEGLTLVTHDEAIRAYDAEILMV